MDEILKDVGRKGWVRDQALGNVYAEEKGFVWGGHQADSPLTPVDRVTV